MKIGIGSDHGGINHKAAIIKHLEELGHTVVNYGTETGASVDYPDIAEKVCKGYLDGAFDLGILVCGTGIGMSIAANKVKGIRAAHATDCYSARMSREHNDAQILCLGERITGVDLALEIVDAYLKAEHQGGRHAKRVEKMMNLQG